MMWSFCLHSILREYGRQFFRRIAAPNPVRTIEAFLQACRIDDSGNMIRLPGTCTPGARSIVGAGFCLKPMDPPCPAGRANHDCAYLEHPPPSDPAACRNCAVREIGMLALKTGSAFYIMTSALDILTDVFAPSLREGRFASGLFVLCRYSVRPFAAGMLASGIRGSLFPFHRGDCRNYRTWLLADRGIKNEQTEILDSTMAGISQILKSPAKEAAPAARFEKKGNVFFAA